MRIKHQNNRMIPAKIFCFIATFLEKEYAFNVDKFLSNRNDCIQNLQANSAKIKATYVTELLNEAIDFTNDGLMLAKLAKLVTPNQLGILGYLMLHSKNAEDAILKLCRYYPLIGKALKPIFIEDDNIVKIVIVMPFDNNELYIQKYHIEIHILAILNLINKTIESKISPQHITLRHGKSNYNIDYEHIFESKVYFEKEENALIFNKNILKTKTICSNIYLLELFEKEAEKLIGLNLHGGFKEEISGLILISSGELDISLESVAKKAKMHPRTLQKRLQEENSSFSILLSDIRKNLAIHYLGKEIDTATIAIYLGYSELSPFLRAFKKWYKMSPKEWVLQSKA